MTARFIVADVFDGLATLEDGSVDLVVTSPPFLALRSYLPADHPDKGKEIGSEATPAEFIDTLLRVTAELRRVLAPHGSICVELGDTYAGSGGAGGDYNEDGLRDGQQKFSGSAAKRAANGVSDEYRPARSGRGTGWPLAKSRTLIPSLYEIALAYGFNPLTGQPSPAGQWRIRNVVTWARPNPPVGALGDKWRPATSDLIVACTSGKRYWDDLATRKPVTSSGVRIRSTEKRQLADYPGDPKRLGNFDLSHSSGAPLLDYWVIPPGGYQGAHYAVFPEELVVPCVKAMCPQRVCRICGEPSRRIVETTYEPKTAGGRPRLTEAASVQTNRRQEPRAAAALESGFNPSAQGMPFGRAEKVSTTTGWTDCGHDNWRLGLVLDPFAGSGTTLAVATGHGHDAIGIDIDARNAVLARDRVGPFLFEMAAL